MLIELAFMLSVFLSGFFIGATIGSEIAFRSFAKRKRTLPATRKLQLILANRA